MVGFMLGALAKAPLGSTWRWEVTRASRRFLERTPQGVDAGSIPAYSTKRREEMLLIKAERADGSKTYLDIEKALTFNQPNPDTYEITAGGALFSVTGESAKKVGRFIADNLLGWKYTREWLKARAG